MNKVDSFKLRILREKLREEGIENPSHQDIQRILGVGYIQAYNYRRALKANVV